MTNTIVKLTQLDKGRSSPLVVSQAVLHPLRDQTSIRLKIDHDLLSPNTCEAGTEGPLD